MSKRKLDIDHTRERLVALGLPYAADQFESVLSCHRPPQWSHSGIAVMEPLHDRRYGAT